jgi:hypothetical protein
MVGVGNGVARNGGHNFGLVKVENYSKGLSKLRVLV